MEVKLKIADLSEGEINEDTDISVSWAVGWIQSHHHLPTLQTGCVPPLSSPLTGCSITAHLVLMCE